MYKICVTSYFWTDTHIANVDVLYLVVRLQRWSMAVGRKCEEGYVGVSYVFFCGSLKFVRLTPLTAFKRSINRVRCDNRIDNRV